MTSFLGPSEEDDPAASEEDKTDYGYSEGHR